MVRRRLSLPFTDVIKDDEVIADEEINKRKWKSYHEIDVKQNMGYGRYIHKIIQNNYNAKIIWITMAAVPTNLIVLNGNLQLDRAKLGSDTKRGVSYMFALLPEILIEI